jgi:hypothetical protein
VKTANFTFSRRWAKIPIQLLLDTGGDPSALVADRERLRVALERVKAHRAACPDRIDRSSLNRRLSQYARGERAELFCDIIGG